MAFLNDILFHAIQIEMIVILFIIYRQNKTKNADKKNVFYARLWLVVGMAFILLFTLIVEFYPPI